MVHTETTYFNAAAGREVYWELGVEQVKILETLDGSTCPLCGPLDGTVIELSQYQAGVTAPPFHPNCRGTICPYFGDVTEEKIAGKVEGEVYYMPENMTFEQRKKAFVDGEKDGLTILEAKDILNVTKQSENGESSVRTVGHMHYG